MVASSDRCQKCGRPFNAIKVSNALRGIFTAFCFLILIGAFVEFAAEEPLFPGITFTSINTIFAAIVVLILVNVAASQTLKSETAKYRTEAGLLCPSCRDKVATEKAQQVVAEQAEKDKWLVELKAKTEGDPPLRSLVQEWRIAHLDMTPDRDTVTELQRAIDLGEAGNFEGSAQIFERHKLWSLAGKMREKARVQMIKHVTVDMNQLLEQIGTKGLAVPYKCQNCGAGITIDKNSSVSGLKFCSYCGTAYNIEEMSKIVQEALAL